MFHDYAVSFVAEGRLWQFEHFPGYFRLYDRLAIERASPDGTLYYRVVPQAFSIQ